MTTSVEQIKERLDIAEVISGYIKLERAGENLKARCPFHNEKTPSFVVSPSRQSFYCFGCSTGGDMFSFVEQYEGVDFKGALRILADRAGIELSSEKPSDREERNVLYDIVESATQYFEEHLSRSDAARKYLKDRGLSEQGMREWRVGYAPSVEQVGWRPLIEKLATRNFQHSDIERAGLLKRREDGTKDKFYDTFRGRIIFPIFDTAGRPIAFSGRSFPDSNGETGAPKYLNSPDTPLFNKSEVLYGLHRAKQSIRRMNFSVLVEGQMDLLLSHERGFTNTVATSGTSLSEAHIKMLKRIAPRLITGYDADEAGRKSAVKHAAQALSLGMEVKIALPEAGKDPADMLKDNAASWKEALAQARHLIDFELDEVMVEARDEKAVVRAVKARILPLIAKLESSIDQDNAIRNVAGRTGISSQAIRSDIKHEVTKESKMSQGREKPSDRRRPLSGEAYIIGILLWQEKEEKNVIDTKYLRKCLYKVISEEDLQTLLEKYRQWEESLVFRVEDEWLRSRDGDEYKKMNEVLANFEIETLKAKNIKLERDGKLLSAEERVESMKKINENLKRIDALNNAIVKMDTV